jgi:glycerol kinase
MLPRIVPSSGAVGRASAASPLPGVAIAGILGDQQAALFGQACFAPGDAKNTYGTGCFLLLNAGEAPPAPPRGSGLLVTIAYQLQGRAAVYALEGSVSVAGAAVSWLRDALRVIDSPRQLEALAASVPDAGGCVLVPAFNGLFAPHWRADARGAWVGLSAGTTRAHLARATLEAVAHQSRELLEAMERGLGAAAAPRGDLRVDGGMTANGLLMQLQADLTGRRCVRPVVAETTALGAAYAAGLASGFWSGQAELSAQWRADAAWAPAASPQAVAASCRDWDRALARCLHWHAPAAAGDGPETDEALALLPARARALARLRERALLAAAAAGAALTLLGLYVFKRLK